MTSSRARGGRGGAGARLPSSPEPLPPRPCSLVLVVAGAGPSVGDVLDAAGQSPAAVVTPTRGPLLEVDVEGTRFPNYEEKFGWRAVAQHEDEVDGRLVRTVDYRKGGETVSYSIVAGDGPCGARRPGPGGGGNAVAPDRRRAWRSRGGATGTPA